MEDDCTMMKQHTPKFKELDTTLQALETSVQKMKQIHQDVAELKGMLELVIGDMELNRDDAKDPKDWNWSAQREIAWAHSSVRQPVPPGIGESISMYDQHYADIDKWFNYDIWCHTEDQLGNE